MLTKVEENVNINRMVENNGLPVEDLNTIIKEMGLSENEVKLIFIDGRLVLASVREETDDEYCQRLIGYRKFALKRCESADRRQREKEEYVRINSSNPSKSLEIFEAEIFECIDLKCSMSKRIEEIDSILDELGK